MWSSNHTEQIYYETSFTDLAQTVEKSEIDLFGVFQNDNQIISDIHFIGALRNFNAVLIPNSWKSSKIDFLKLPAPEN